MPETWQSDFSLLLSKTDDLRIARAAFSHKKRRNEASKQAAYCISFRKTLDMSAQRPCPQHFPSPVLTKPPGSLQALESAPGPGSAEEEPSECKTKMLRSQGLWGGTKSHHMFFFYEHLENRVQRVGRSVPSASPETFGSKPSLPPVATSAAWLQVSLGGAVSISAEALSWRRCGAEVVGCPMFFCCCTEEREGFDAVPVAPRQ